MKVSVAFFDRYVLAPVIKKIILEVVALMVDFGIEVWNNKRK